MRINRATNPVPPRVLVAPSLEAHGDSGSCISDWPIELPTLDTASGSISLQAFFNVLMDFDTLSQSLSPGAAIHNANLTLPATCDPPSENNPPKRAVWIVRCASVYNYAL